MPDPITAPAPSNAIQFPKVPASMGSPVPLRVASTPSDDEEELDLDALPPTELIAFTSFEARKLIAGLEDGLDTLEKVLPWTDHPQYEALHAELDQCLLAVEEAHEVAYQVLRTAIARAKAKSTGNGLTGTPASG